MTTDKKGAEQAWKDFLKQRYGLFYLQTMDGRVASTTALDDYKAALRAELKSLADPQNYNGAHDFDDGMIHAYKQAIELLETVTPKEK